MELGEKLSLLRKQWGMTQMELAEALDISRQAVSRWEQGVSEPSTANLIRMGQLFGVPVDALVNGDTHSPPEADAQASEANPEETNPEEVNPDETDTEEADTEEVNPDEADTEGAKPEAAAPKGAEDPPRVIPPRRWLVAVCAGVVCALLLGIAALVEVHSLKQRLDPDNVIPEEQVERKEVDEAIIMEPGTLHP